MSAKETSRVVQAIKTVVVVLAAAFAVLSAGCAAEHEPTTTFSPVPESM
ncbi:hypothetical protein [Mycobacterium attenuatum]|uniref:Uncharacterized protein n=1 Tax=Mycobacterium attenuatum TaxID=2341086 RepID=A0A498PXE4_9MYCO|nr:hypothetical protein [Mycobacterium attenuatum]VBA36765.1 hypothetical protein LAUMK136_01570 [Mycobacterium attenuatum]VBA49510.1 hypothetical protein LAUMK191_01562 [Mycobacterium attenuatum]VBA54993.1 hypothetical protein LAUMK41_01634 [Mycobacterium attenuatum]